MNYSHQAFILQMIKHGDKQLAYQAAYPKCSGGESARKAAERLLRNPEIAGEIQEAVAHIRHQAYTEAYQLQVESQKGKILGIMKKREILNQIATCEMKVGRYVKEEDRYFMVYQDPRPADIIKAIEVDTRLEEACNRARNISDKEFSQFNIYIDGRPYGDPDAPINHDIPKGLVMLPQKRRNNLPEHGNKTEQNTLSPAGGGGRAADGGGTLAQDTTTQEQTNNETPLLFLGVENGECEGICHSGVVYSCKKPAPDTHFPPDEVMQVKMELVQEKRTSREKDPLSESFYKNFVTARDSTPPPHIFTDEELQEINHAANAEKRPLAKRPGKMYFTEKDIEPGNGLKG